MLRRLRLLIFPLIFLCTSTRLSFSQENDEPFQLTAADGFVLDGKIHLPPDSRSDEVGMVIILLHGSGPQSMDADFTTVSKEGKRNLFFEEIGDALSNAGFAVVRYNKRSYQMNLRKQEDADFLNSEIYKAFACNPLKFFVDDAMDSVRFAEERFPEADVYLLGHSQGAFIALQVAHQLPQIKGVALIGFSVSSTETLLFEQTVYRPLALFTELDINRDGDLDMTELGAEDPIAASLRAQKVILDLDGDGKIEQLEFQAGNLSNLLARDLLGALRKQEATYPRSSDILASASFKVAFFQGLWDNQTPAYNTKAVELVAKNVWKKDNFAFTYFPKLGHALDARSAYDDLQYDTIDTNAKESLAKTLSTFFERQP